MPTEVELNTPLFAHECLSGGRATADDRLDRPLRDDEPLHPPHESMLRVLRSRARRHSPPVLWEDSNEEAAAAANLSLLPGAASRSSPCRKGERVAGNSAARAGESLEDVEGLAGPGSMMPIHKNAISCALSSMAPKKP
ncbi:hypothetical protein UVI_02060170 [Ustilaginoidea virens]|nr:hypothetical protein UVI_02060170 [Ustilaginoidea virens]